MAIKLTGTNIQGDIVEYFIHGSLIYDESWKLTIDPLTLKIGDLARAHYGIPGIILTQDPEEIKF